MVCRILAMCSCFVIFSAVCAGSVETLTLDSNSIQIRKERPLQARKGWADFIVSGFLTCASGFKKVKTCISVK